MALISETAADHGDVEALLDLAFGADRHARTAYRFRDGVAPVAALCHVARDGAGALRGSLRFWPIRIPGIDRGLLLGPIAVRPDDRGLGYGRALIWHGLAEARRLGWQAVLLVGDEPYYGQFGFQAERAAELRLPGPYDQARLLGRDLIGIGLMTARGLVEPAREVPTG